MTRWNRVCAITMVLVMGSSAFAVAGSGWFRGRKTYRSGYQAPTRQTYRSGYQAGTPQYSSPQYNSSQSKPEPAWKLHKTDPNKYRTHNR